jgi:hypothetical protein
VPPEFLEKRTYLNLALKHYWTADYVMWIPAFHVVDKQVKGQRQLRRADDMLIKGNFNLYHSVFNILALEDKDK